MPARLATSRSSCRTHDSAFARIWYMYSCTIGKLYSLITSAFVHEASKREVKLSRVRRYAHGRVKAVSLYDSPRFALGKGPTDSISNSRTTLFNFGKMKGRGGGVGGEKGPLTALRSLSTSLKLRQPLPPSYLAGLSTIKSHNPSRSNLPRVTILKDTISAPSSKILTEVGGMDPGRIPPTSA